MRRLYNRLYEFNMLDPITVLKLYSRLYSQLQPAVNCKLRVRKWRRNHYGVGNDTGNREPISLGVVTYIYCSEKCYAPVYVTYCLSMH